MTPYSKTILFPRALLRSGGKFLSRKNLRAVRDGDLHTYLASIYKISPCSREWKVLQTNQSPI